ncbi:alpha/beta fold hydrolase [Streptomyces somaliensis DSM 40738]|uniref:alpha/beta fold hydrolase n=1 Tax=Streptomyces somaliensis TaxID=78355 RepID=UPI0021C3000E|nr:alpha/beta fold hydrolase [Streptomyces somaliensis]MCQ0025599.1 alpha/beta fold hydrolase [Streptomyces somaliensis DSM 40738]
MTAARTSESRPLPIEPAPPLPIEPISPIHPILTSWPLQAAATTLREKGVELKRASWEPRCGPAHSILRFDLPGHGGSRSAVLPDPVPGRTTVGHLASLVLALADHHGWGRFHYAGISLGGAIGAYLAVRYPGRVASLALVCSSAYFGPAGLWRERAGLVRVKGTASLLGVSSSRWFATADVADSSFGRGLLGDLAGVDPVGYAACCDALADYDLRPELAVIRAPVLVVGGTLDTATPLEHARELAGGIPHAVLHTIACGHLAAERPGDLQGALTAHLSGLCT